MLIFFFYSFQSSEIHYAAYEADWRNLSLRERKSILLILLRATKPFQITGGKIFYLSRQLFVKV